MTSPGPRADAEVTQYWRSLGLPGLIDVHVHFLPDRLQDKVWAYFDGAAGTNQAGGSVKLGAVTQTRG